MNIQPLEPALRIVHEFGLLTRFHAPCRLVPPMAHVNGPVKDPLPFSSSSPSTMPTLTSCTIKPVRGRPHEVQLHDQAGPPIPSSFCCGCLHDAEANQYWSAIQAIPPVRSLSRRVECL